MTDGGAERRERAEEGQLARAVRFAEPEREHDVSWLKLGMRWRDLHPRVGGELVVQAIEARVAGDLRFAVQARQQVRAPLVEVQRPRRHAARVQRDAQGVGRWLEKVGRDSLGEQCEASFEASSVCWRSTTSAG